MSQSGILAVSGSAGTVNTLTPDTGGPVSPVLGNINVSGLNGITTINGGAGILQISNLQWFDRAAPVTVAANTGNFFTAAITLTLPAAPTQGSVCKFTCENAPPCVIQANAGQIISIGFTSSAVAGSATSTNNGDALELVFRSAANEWIATASIGSWTLA